MLFTRRTAKVQVLLVIIGHPSSLPYSIDRVLTAGRHERDLPGIAAQRGRDLLNGGAVLTG